jgi:hypothetical protein
MNDSIRLSLSRRNFLRTTLGASVGAAISMRSYAAQPLSFNPKQKVIVVTFGGGARDDETFSLEGQQYIPHLLGTLAPQCTFFTQVINRGILGHYVATATIATGAYETFDNFVAQPPVHPTIFEYFRKDLGRPHDDAWVIAPGSLFAEMGSSRSRRYGPHDGAQVIIPKQLLATVLGGASGMHLDSYPYLLRDSYEAPDVSDRPGTSAEQEKMEAMLAKMKIDRTQLRTTVDKFESPDALSLYMTKHVMRTFAPSLIFLTLHDMDIAHSGAYSLYLDGIRRTDRLCADLWNEVQQNPEYKDRTTVLILPDFGRDGDNDPGGNGFQHHRTGSPSARTTWMMALGPEIRPRTIVHRPIESIDLAPTVMRLFGADARLAQGKLIPELA